MKVDHALKIGARGLPRGSSLARLLSEYRGAWNLSNVPNLTIPQILRWADAYYESTGHWPTVKSGPIPSSPRENWNKVDNALRRGTRGLPGGSSLARVLQEYRGARNHLNLPELTVSQILAWADACHESTGRWPTKDSGPIPGSLGENWRKIDNALRLGLRGLPGKSSLAQLLEEHRGVRNLRNLPHLTIPQILAWADSHYHLTGRWPTAEPQLVPDSGRENWQAIDVALRLGARGLPGGSSLAQVLDTHRGVRNLQNLPPLTQKQILAWADAHHQLTGQWPTHKSGEVPGVPGQTWSAVNEALMVGRRGLPGGSSLAQLLAERRGVRNKVRPPRLTVKQILEWADKHVRRTGTWPTRLSGPIIDAPGESWASVHWALRDGRRGLPGGSSLPLLLAERRGVLVRGRFLRALEKIGQA